MLGKFYFTTPTTETKIVSPQDKAEWLEEKIKFYEAEVKRLQAELKHVQILLTGHKTWKQDVERKRASND